ncbi:sigma-70 family RNA polymerase sigma factor [Paenibacillus sp. 2RAB27]|uniref:sigma-70 family RNA polymerase sigma factor n=1 Tax=Paenibacillus sp. 2RAB27 TaxID=3232991 RepID=UPI003F975468
MNEAAFDMKLFESYKPGLTSYCYRMLGSIDDADDAVQETYIRAWQSWDRFRQDSSIKTWVYRIASNLCLDKLRQAKRRTLPVDLSDPDALVRKDTLQLCFIALLQTLPPRQRAVLILKDVFEWSSKQIAETLGMSPAAANSALQRARETMDRTRLRSDEFSKMNVNPDQNLLLRYVEAFEQFDIHA